MGYAEQVVLIGCLDGLSWRSLLSFYYLGINLLSLLAVFLLTEHWPLLQSESGFFSGSLASSKHPGNSCHSDRRAHSYCVVLCC